MTQEAPECRNENHTSRAPTFTNSEPQFWHDELPGSSKTISNVFSKLVREGELFPVRRGVYWRGVKTPLGMSSPPDSAVVAELVGEMKGVGPAGLSAASTLWLSSQVFQIPADRGARKGAGRHVDGEFLDAFDAAGSHQSGSDRHRGGFFRSAR